MDFFEMDKFIETKTPALDWSLELREGRGGHGGFGGGEAKGLFSANKFEA